MDQLLASVTDFARDHWIVASLLVLGAVAWAWEILAGKRGLRKKAEKMFHQFSRTIGSSHEFVPVSIDEFTWCDREFYESVDSDLTENHQFHFIADIEDKTLTEIHPSMRTCIRSLAGPQGAVVAGIFHLRVRGLGGWLLKLCGQKASQKIVEFETEFSDGVVLSTTTSGEENKLSKPRRLLCKHVPSDTSLDEQLQIHMACCSEYLASHAGLTWTRMASLEDLLAFQQRFHRMHQEHRKEVGGGITDEEFDRHAASLPESVKAQFKREFARLRKEQRGAENPGQTQPQQSSPFQVQAR